MGIRWLSDRAYTPPALGRSAVLIGVIFIGFPIAFTLLFLALVFGYVGLGGMVFDLMFFQTIGMMKEEVLAAVPLFIFMGYVTEQAGLVLVMIFPQIALWFPNWLFSPR